MRNDLTHHGSEKPWKISTVQTWWKLSALRSLSSVCCLAASRCVLIKAHSENQISGRPMPSVLRKVNSISLGSKGWDLCLLVGYNYAVGIQARIGAVTIADMEKCPLRVCEELHIQFLICFSVSPSSLPSTKSIGMNLEN